MDEEQAAGKMSGKTHIIDYHGQEAMCWRSRLSTAFRTGFGCFLYGLLLHLLDMDSKYLQKHKSASWLAFPIFGYVIVVRVVGESTLGKALLESSAMALGAAQSTFMAYIVLQLFSKYFTNIGIIAACIFVSSFIIALPTCLNIFHKRVALAHTGIVYITALVQHPHMDFLFPIKLFTTIIVAAACGMLALLLPKPRRAHAKVQSHTNSSVHVTIQRLKVLVDGFCVDNNTKALALILKAKSLEEVVSTLNIKINSIMEDMKREAQFLPFYNDSPRLELMNYGLASIYKILTGMELALQADVASSPPKRLQRHIIHESLVYMTEWVSLVLGSMKSQQVNIIKEGQRVLSSLDRTILAMMQEEIGYPSIPDVCTISHGGQDRADIPGKSHSAYGDTTLSKYPPSSSPRDKAGAPFRFAEHAPAAFFIFKVHELVVETGQIFKSWNAPKPLQNRPALPEQPIQKLCAKCMHAEERAHDKRFAQYYSIELNFQQLKSVFRLALTMALGAFLGYSFNKQKGYWADITVAMGFRALLKGDVYKIASLRVLGISCGSIYGLLVARSAVHLPPMRYVALIPWVILTSFLRKSRIFAYGGGLSSFTAAVVILGTKKSKDFTDQDFTVIRIVEALLGLATFVLIEILVCPHRVRSKVKLEMLAGTKELHKFAGSILEAYSDNHCDVCRSVELRDEQRKLKKIYFSLTQLVKAAGNEPQFCFEPFQEKLHLEVIKEQTIIVEMLYICIEGLNAVERAAGGKVSMDKLLQGELKAAMSIVLEKKVVPMLELLAEVLAFDGKAKHVSTEPLIKLSLNDEGCLDAFERGAIQLVYARINKLKAECGDTNIMSSNAGDLCFDASSNTMFLSLGTLAFAVKGLLHHARELHKATIELFEAKNPLMLVHI